MLIPYPQGLPRRRVRKPGRAKSNAMLGRHHRAKPDSSAGYTVRSDPMPEGPRIKLASRDEDHQ
nr:hypothetical protein JVH1_7347 [Rhodococcus sp. JVH1]